MPRTLPPKPDLVRLRREARALQRACLAGEAEAAQRLAAVFADLDPRQAPLTKVQTLIARDYGFPSWPALKAEVEARRVPPLKPAAAIDAETLAERWFVLAEGGELDALNRALAIGKRREQAACAVMLKQPARYAAFVAALTRGLESPRDRTRFECAHALDQFGDAASRGPLARLMEDPGPRVRWMAMHALSCHACGEKSDLLEPAIRARIARAALSDPSPHVRRHAATALALAEDRTAAPILREMLERETDGKILRAVAWALSELTRPPRPAKAAAAGV